MNTLQSEPENPLGSSDARKYAAGRFLWIKNDTSTFYQAGTLTWNRTDGQPSGITESSDDPPAQSYGFYKNAKLRPLVITPTATWMSEARPPATSAS